MAKASPSNVPSDIGINLLLPLNKVLVQQKREFMQPNKYKVLTPDGSVLYMVKEDATALQIGLIGGKNRAFTINVEQINGEEAFRMRRPVIWTVQEMQVITATGQLVSIVRQKPTWFKPVLLINDATDKLVLRVKCTEPSGFTCDFDIQTPDKTRIGVIRRIWSGFKKELFKGSTDFEIEFPADLDVRYKAAIISTCVLIDFMYYEGK